MPSLAEGKVVTAVDELKEPDCGNATEETEKDAEVEKSDYIDTNNMDKLRLSKNRPRSCLNMMQAKTITKGEAEVNLAQILHGATEEYLSHIHLCGYGSKYSCFNRDL